MTRIHPRRAAAAAAAVSLALVAAACGSDTKTTTSSTAAGSSTTAAAAGSSTTKAATASSAAAGSSTSAAATAKGQAVTLGSSANEFAIAIPDAVKAGAVTFALTNGGQQRHALAVAKGESYAALPKLDNGAVDTEKLGADFIGKSDILSGGGTGTVTFNLPAGKYVFFCPVAAGPNSHAKAGQTLPVTVA